MTDHTKIKIANAFYSKPRGAFLPLTAGDILARTNLAEDVAKSARISMMKGGFVSGVRTGDKARSIIVYNLTPTGRKLVEATQ